MPASLIKKNVHIIYTSSPLKPAAQSSRTGRLKALHPHVLNRPWSAELHGPLFTCLNSQSKSHSLKRHFQWAKEPRVTYIFINHAACPGPWPPGPARPPFPQDAALACQRAAKAWLPAGPCKPTLTYREAQGEQALAAVARQRD